MDWLALVGAGAWLPHVWGALKKRILRPTVAIVPDTELDVQFDEDGAGIQVALAFEVRELDCTVRDMTAVLSHTAGRRQTLTWAEYVENVGHMVIPGAGVGTFIRGQRAIAIRLEGGQLSERIINFQSREFSRRLRALAHDLGRLHRRRDGHGDDTRARLLASREFQLIADAY